jgi:hypothetical protein
MGRLTGDLAARSLHSALGDLQSSDDGANFCVNRLVRPSLPDWEQARRPLVRWRITVDLRELIDQLRDLRFTYPVPGDGPVADKVATLLEQAIAGKGAIEHD